MKYSQSIGKKIPLKAGKSGAQVFLTEHETVMKTVRRCEADEALWNACLREILFYEQNADHSIPFLPQILYTEHTHEQLTLEMRYYRPMNPLTMTREKIMQILSALAQLHSMTPPECLPPPAPTLPDSLVLIACADGWKSVFSEHKDLFSAYQSFPGHAAAAFRKINLNFDLHRTDFCHGDFHIGNILVDDADKPIFIDFQNCSIGDGIGDVSFLHSRLNADGIALSLEELMQIYSTCSGISVSILRLQAALANFNTSFLYWHQYLHGSDADRVQSIFNVMQDDFLLLSSEF